MFRMLRLKPPHGWNAVVWEFAIVTLGVLMALAAQQVVEELSSAQKAEDAHSAIKVEMQGNYVNAKERLAVEQCINRQLDTLARRVLAETRVNVPAPVIIVANHIAMVVRYPGREWTATSWDSAIVDGARPHFEASRRATLDYSYALLARLRIANDEEAGAIAELGALAYPVPMDAAVKARFVTLIEAERSRSGIMALIAQQLVAELDRIGFAAPASAVQRRVGGSVREGTVAWCRDHNQGLPVRVH